MSFKFQRCANPEIGEFAYEMPPIPPGVSSGLTALIEAYSAAVRDLDEHVQDARHAAISAFEARSIPDTIAKLSIQLHFDHSGLDDDRLVLCPRTERHTAILAMEPLLADLYRQVPASSTGAALAEADFDQRVWRPAYKQITIAAIDALVTLMLRADTLLRASVEADNRDDAERLAAMAGEEMSGALNALRPISHGESA